MWAWSAGTFGRTGEFTGLRATASEAGGRLVNAMFLEDVGRDEPTIGEWAFRFPEPCFALQ
jgi:hypothetical protein